jgi:hypothetical protein
LGLAALARLKGYIKPGYGYVRRALCYIAYCEFDVKLNPWKGWRGGCPTRKKEYLTVNWMAALPCLLTVRGQIQ